MTVIDEIVESLVKRAKENDRIDNVRFIKAYKNHLAENPVEGFMAVVNIESINREQRFVGGYLENSVKGDIYSAKLLVSVYSASTVSGEDLGSTAINISEAFKDADESGIIDDIYIGPITFDENNGAIYREITMSLEFCLCGEK